jgi:hypothetical protein
VHEDFGSILIADVAELPVRHERIDVVPEVIEQRGIRDASGVVQHLDRFDVPGASAETCL